MSQLKTILFVMGVYLLVPLGVQAQESSPGKDSALVSVKSLTQDIKVLDPNKKEVGTVKDVMLNPDNGKLTRAEITLSKGGSGQISVPWNQLSLKRQEGDLVVVLNQQAYDKINNKQRSQRSEKQEQTLSTRSGSGSFQDTSQMNTPAPEMSKANQSGQSSESGQTLAAIQSLAQSKVVDGQNKEIGTVTSIMVNPESGKLVRANISLDNNSGFLSFGDQDQHISVPWDQISVKRRQGNMVLVLNQQAIDKIKTEKVKKDETSQGSEKSQQENK